VKRARNGKAYDAPESPCPWCGCVCDRASEMMPGSYDSGPAAPPQPGAPSVCLYCGGINVFGEDMLLRKMTPAETLRLQLAPVPIWNELVRNSRAAKLLAARRAGVGKGAARREAT